MRKGYWVLGIRTEVCCAIRLGLQDLDVGLWAQRLKVTFHSVCLALEPALRSALNASVLSGAVKSRRLILKLLERRKVDSPSPQSGG